MAAWTCADCGRWTTAFSRNQRERGCGTARCSTCVEESLRQVQCRLCDRWLGGTNALEQHMQTHPAHECGECQRTFANAEALRQHSKTHQPRTVPCPACNNKLFRNAANAAAHFESGYCTGCLGKERAQQAVWEFMRINEQASQYIAPQIADYGFGYEAVPDRAYQCRYCAKRFGLMSALLNHEGDSHNSVSAPLRLTF
jgi:hypothetical protein